MSKTHERRALASNAAAAIGPQEGEVQAGLRISPLFNEAFLWIFGRQDSKEVTRSLANAILRRAGLGQIGKIDELRADAASPGGIEMRTSRADVVIVSEEGTTVDLEAQRERVNVDNKALFYASKLLCEGTPRGAADDYSDLPQVIVIILIDGWKMFEGDSFLSVGRIRWKHGDGSANKFEDGTDRTLYVVAELDKVRKVYTANSEEMADDEALAWLYLLADGYSDDHEMERVMERFENIQEFAERYKLAMGDPELKRAYEKYLEARMEYNDILHEGQRWARKEGRKEGRKETRKDVLVRMRELGYDEDAIAAVLDGIDEGDE